MTIYSQSSAIIGGAFLLLINNILYGELGISEKMVQNIIFLLGNSVDVAIMTLMSKIKCLKQLSLYCQR